jgi:redox-sensitive bicupin YhaK (pirin superfamily)
MHAESPPVSGVLFCVLGLELLEPEEIMSTLPSSGDLRFSSPVTRAPHPVGAHCDIRQFRHTDFGGAMSPLVLVDHFVMTGPTFELHPHAGMSAVTVLFEETQGWMSSHDSVHNDHRIEPGDLHWTLAGKGIVHTQQPEGDHARLDGLQLFVNLPRHLKRIEPATMLLHARDVPVIEDAGKRLRVLAGALGDKASPLRTPEPILIVDGWLDAGARIVVPVPSGWNLWLYARLGRLTAHNTGGAERAAGATLSSGEAVTVSADQAGALELRAADGAIRFVAIAGSAIDEPIVQSGPFVMNTRNEAEQAMADFKAGKFGTVTSFT